MPQGLTFRVRFVPLGGGGTYRSRLNSRVIGSPRRRFQTMRPWSAWDALSCSTLSGLTVGTEPSSPGTFATIRARVPRVPMNRTNISE